MSFKPVSQFTNILSGSKLEFGTITRKSRLMRRRRQSPNSNCSLFGGPFISDFKEMGIVAVGPRRKLFTAIQQLKGSR